MKKTRKKSHSLDVFCRALKKPGRFLLSCHVTPEGDAIGSILAMQSLLKRLGKKTLVVNEDHFPVRLGCLSDKSWNQIDQVKIRPQDYDALVVADCPTLERIGRVTGLVHPHMTIFNIDHHISNQLFGHYNYVQGDAAASGEVVFDIFKHLKMPLTKEDATNLYVALTTDTGSFKHGNTSVKSHRVAAELIAAGIDLEVINEELYCNYSINKTNLYSRLLGRIKTASKGKVAWVYLKRSDLHETGALYEDTEGFVDFLKFIKEVKVAFFLSELPEGGKVRVSFRSKDVYDVNKIATFFKGGGHKKASGCIMPGPIETAEKKILARIQEEFKL